MRHEVVEQLISQKLIVIIRVKDPSDIEGIVQCMSDAGVLAVEVTSNTPGYEMAITQLRQQFPHMLIGVGTVTDHRIAKRAIKAGAQFLVTPNTNEAIVRHAHALDVPVVMGAMTPTDIVDASQFNADIIKLFPAGPMGANYLQALAHGPFLDTYFFPVGGIDASNIDAWFDSGASGVGIGGSLAQPVYSPQQAEQLTKNVSEIVAKINAKELTRKAS
ncbi:2-dehydro-3-deoxyphosphogluconate aldolase [Shewanella sp. UCD-FRSSP16_17]|uniref:bifunctional 4-hydroxy-2-oxoglutarate aldolase/2-dehydro-3-deoxy-phosphogluconate aldolase n=1 Tax=Shewanella sp. UCD-FRSSP16_17 TaxID=1853256 RepID=UPI0007EEF34B|nr:bifunctional 4-hydroxy-2-oxoglutarate aldolase/2-dehydro-3-deoxy-phosphogluconate aldolase [Shewanella sp. UCD-FRSSP16_17]OBT11607.1 2-dehydro-3-deoxyphosphogluconate aldolase [Shewanella sp. UCD-FRSSP16_17]